MTHWIFHSELSQLELMPWHAKFLFLPITVQHEDIRSTGSQFVSAYSTAGPDKVYGQGKRILCTLDREINGHREQKIANDC